MAKTKFLTSRVTIDEHKQILSYCKQIGEPVSEFVRQTILFTINDKKCLKNDLMKSDGICEGAYRKVYPKK